MIAHEQLGKITVSIDKLRSYLEIDKKKILIQNEEEKSANPDFWNNPKEAELVMKNLRGLKKWVNDYEKIVGLKDDLSVVLDFFKEGEESQEQVDDAFAQAKIATESSRIMGI